MVGAAAGVATEPVRCRPTALEAHPAAMQLRVLATTAEVSVERNSTLIFPVPVELMRLVDTLRAPGAARKPEASGR